VYNSGVHREAYLGYTRVVYTSPSCYSRVVYISLSCYSRVLLVSSQVYPGVISLLSGIPGLTLLITRRYTRVDTSHNPEVYPGGISLFPTRVVLVSSLPGCYSRFTVGLFPPSLCWGTLCGGFLCYSRLLSRFTVGQFLHIQVNIPVLLLGLYRLLLPAPCTRFTVGHASRVLFPFHCWTTRTTPSTPVSLLERYHGPGPMFLIKWLIPDIPGRTKVSWTLIPGMLEPAVLAVVECPQE